MANVEHSQLTGSSLHEPKGVAAAAANRVYITDGVGSGAHGQVTLDVLASTAKAFQGQLLHLQDQKASGTDGATITSGDWRTRELNTSVTNEITGASLGSNQITLPSGTYYIDVMVSWSKMDALGLSQQVRLRNVTDGSTVLTGLNSVVVRTDSNNGFSGNTNNFLRGRFTIASQKVFEIQHRANETILAGNKTSFGTEVYADVAIWKVA